MWFLNRSGQTTKKERIPSGRMLPQEAGRGSGRLSNEVDFWRGFALIIIFINHMPGIWFENYTTRNYGTSDSAELFVFLAGFSLRYLADSRTENLTTPRLFMRLEGRAFTLYTAHLLTTVLALALLAGAAIWFETSLLLEWHNARAFFQDTAATIIGIALLSHHLGYFDILPLYIVLLAMSPFIVLLYRLSPTLLLAVSVSIWAVTLTFAFNLPTWPVENRWFFNPLAWQLCFVTGFLLAKPVGLGHWARTNLFWLRLAAIPILIAGFVIKFWDYWPNALEVPWPEMFFIANKTFLTPLRFFHMLALAALMTGVFAFAYRYKLFQPLGGYLCMLGRNSLHVFCAGSILSLLGQIVRFASPPSFLTDLGVVCAGLILMSAIAWANEWRTRL